MMFFETMRPSSVDLSRKGRSSSSYRSKSTGNPDGCRSNVNVETGQIFRGGSFTREKLRTGELPASALNCFALPRCADGGAPFRSVEEAIVSAEAKDLLLFRALDATFFFSSGLLSMFC